MNRIMKFLPKSLLSILSLLTVSAASSTALLSRPAHADFRSPNSVQLAQGASSADAFYGEARSLMESTIGQDYYVIYRVVERLARSNGLDEQPWRVRVSSAQNVNAFASELNMLTFEGGLLEQVSGDHGALACVVGHEMAHHTKNHIPQMVEMMARLEALQEEALEDARDEVESANRNNAIFGTVLNVLGGTVANTTGLTSSRTGLFATSVVSQTLDGLNEEQTQQAIARAEELYAERLEEIDGEYSETMHRHESEADEFGYRYIVRAGFDPSGCSRVMTVLSRLENSRLPSLTHPNPEDRLARLSSFNTAAANQQLVNEGNANLSRSPSPLKYGVARDQGSLRIESRYGSRDIDEGFPQ